VFLQGCSISLLGKAQKKGVVEINPVQIRDFATDKHRKVDDTPYGGGEGMLLKVDVLYAALKSVVPEKKSGTRTILLSPQGKVFTQEKAKELSKLEHMVLVCGGKRIAWKSKLETNLLSAIVSTP